MSARPSVMTCFCLVALAASITAQTRDTSGSSNYDIAEFDNVMIPTRDGVRLATNVYRKVSGDPAYAAVVRVSLRPRKSRMAVPISLACVSSAKCPVS